MAHKFQFIFIVLLICHVSPLLAEGEAAGSHGYCAAILPCTEDGSVLPAFLGGECEVVYQAQCAAAQQNRDASVCEDNIAKLASDHVRLKNRFRKMRKD